MKVIQIGPIMRLPYSASSLRPRRVDIRGGVRTVISAPSRRFVTRGSNKNDNQLGDDLLGMLTNEGVMLLSAGMLLSCAKLSIMQTVYPPPYDGDYQLQTFPKHSHEHSHACMHVRYVLDFIQAGRKLRRWYGEGERSKDKSEEAEEISAEEAPQVDAYYMVYI